MFCQNHQLGDLISGVKGRIKGVRKVLLRVLLVAMASTLLPACLGQPALHRSVLGYDETVLTTEQQLLLLNIARQHNGIPVHFTTTSNIAATFDWTKSAGLGGRLEEKALRLPFAEP